MSQAATLPLPAAQPRELTRWAPWLLLFGRMILFIAVQSIFALGFFLAGSTAAWEASAAWWMMGVGLSNLLCLAALLYVFGAEGQSYWALFHIQTENLRKDWWPFLGLLLITGPVAMLPSSLLGTWLFGDAQTTLAFLLRPLPIWGVWLSIVLFPITQGVVELALYFGYVMPRLVRPSAGRPSWLALTVCVLMLGLQHAAAPLIFDARYLIWRGLMFVPFALQVGLVMRWRPRFLAYLAPFHALMDLSFALMALELAY